MRVFVTGATGFMGRRLMRDLLRRGDGVVALTRDRQRLLASSLPEASDRLQVVEGDPAAPGAWQGALAGCDAVVALAGEPIIGQRFTPALKERAERSRVGGITQICQGIAALPEGQCPKVLLPGSAVGYYGPHGDEDLTEESPPGQDYLAELCVRWEAAAAPARALGLRVAPLRTGIVLGTDGGMLAKMLPAFRLFVGGPIGPGSQPISWVHIGDATAMILHALDRGDVTGPMNLTAPQPVTMAEMAAALGEVLHRPALLKVPAVAVRALFGGEGAGPLTTGQRALPRVAQRTGYRFQFPDLRAALQDLV